MVKCRPAVNQYLVYCYPKRGGRATKSWRGDLASATKLAERLASGPARRECEVHKLMRRCG